MFGYNFTLQTLIKWKATKLAGQLNSAQTPFHSYFGCIITSIPQLAHLTAANKYIPGHLNFN
jgi:hypothetical protein